MAEVSIAVARDQTFVPVNDGHASAGESLERALANAVKAAVGDPGALAMVGPAHVTVVQWHGGAEAAWHAETPCEWADAIEWAPMAPGGIRAGAPGDAMATGLLDAVLDWRPGWPPETEGW